MTIKPGTTLRVARPTDRLHDIAAMYEKGLGFGVLSSFSGHDGFDGIILGHPGHPYHLEFTQQSGHDVGKAPTKDHLLVFYVADSGEWRAACERMTAAGFEQVPSYNPYWDERGRTFEDLDGYRVVLENAAWAR